ncbi:MAG: hypothetical protein ICV63_02460 [Coleofasciculus sp. Co-bin14]|nr:hypothetical protein [Coleofasciculus sp. Co-bin14]
MTACRGDSDSDSEAIARNERRNERRNEHQHSSENVRSATEIVNSEGFALLVCDFDLFESQPHLRAGSLLLAIRLG